MRLSRHATGGSIPGILPRLSDQELNVTLSQNNTGNVSLSRVKLSSRNVSLTGIRFVTDVREVLYL